MTPVFKGLEDVNLILIVSGLIIFLTHGGSFPCVFDFFFFFPIVNLYLPGLDLCISQEA